MIYLQLAENQIFVDWIDEENCGLQKVWTMDLSS
jgi:hypothetical protein